MHQFFCDTPLQIGEPYILTKEQAHHAENVARLLNEKVRLVHSGEAWFGVLEKKDGKVTAMVTEKDENTHENRAEIILAMALIRREKFELVLQKATELGVTRIIPFESGRCVVRSKEEKAAKNRQRRMDIVREAAQQCKRNVIPEVSEAVSFDEMLKTEAECRMAAYENAYGSGSTLSQIIGKQKSFLIVIGPEGGFSEEEMDRMKAEGLIEVTLGSRILRAETAAISACALISELSENQWI